MKRCAELLIVAAALVAAGCATGPKRAEPLSEGRDRSEQPERPTPDPEAALEGTVEERYAQAQAFLANEQNDAARRVLTALTRERTDLSGPPTNLGILEVRAERYQAAETWLREAIKRNPDNIIARNWLAHAHRENRRPESAEAMWLEALDVDPDYVAAHVNLGRLYEEVLADLQAAVRHYRAAYEASDGTELRVLPWIARLEERLQSRSPATDSNTAVGADNASQGGSAPSQQP